MGLQVQEQRGNNPNLSGKGQRPAYRLFKLKGNHMARDDVHILGIANNTLWYIIYYANKLSWHMYENVYSEENNYAELGTVADVGCATVGPNLLHVLLTSNTGLWHTYRNAPSNQDTHWQPGFGYVNGQESNSADAGTFRNIRAAGTTAGDGTLHVVGDGIGGSWHTIRWDSGYWQPSYDFIEFSNTSSQVTNSACAADAHGNLFVWAFSYTLDGLPQYELLIRDESGKWSTSTTWHPLPTNGLLSQLSLATDGRGNLASIMVTDQGTLYGTLYFASKKQWPQGWATLAPNGEIPVNADDPQNFVDASCAFLSNGDLVLLAIGSNSTTTQGLFRTTYSMDTRTWQPWTSINAQMANPGQTGPFIRCGIGISTAS